MKTWKKLTLNVGINVASGIIMAFATPAIHSLLLNWGSEDTGVSATPARARISFSLYEIFADFMVILIISSIAGIVMCNKMWFSEDKLHRLRFAKFAYCIFGGIAGAFGGAVVSLLTENIMALICISFGGFIGVSLGWSPLIMSERHAYLIPFGIYIGGAVGGVIGRALGEDFSILPGLGALVGVNVCAIIGGLTGGYMCGKRMYLRSLK